MNFKSEKQAREFIADYKKVESMQIRIRLDKKEKLAEENKYRNALMFLERQRQERMIANDCCQWEERIEIFLNNKIEKNEKLTKEDKFKLKAWKEDYVKNTELANKEVNMRRNNFFKDMKGLKAKLKK